MPLKRQKFGRKVFIICYAESGYSVNFISYTGVGTNLNHDRELGYTGLEVITLMLPYMGKNTTFTWIVSTQIQDCLGFFIATTLEHLGRCRPESKSFQR